MDTKAIVIVGAVTSGKTTLANRLAKKLNYSLINEESTGNYFNIIHNIKSSKFPKAIYEHCYLYTQIELFCREYKSVTFVTLELSKNSSRKIIVTE